MTREEALQLLDEMMRQPDAAPDLDRARLAAQYVRIRGDAEDGRVGRAGSPTEN